MQLKITTDYAVRIVYYLALHRGTVTAAELSEALKIPESYIPKITKKLKDANMITACEGIKGGYSLSRKPEDISLFDIAVWKKMDFVPEMPQIIAVCIRHS